MRRAESRAPTLPLPSWSVLLRRIVTRSPSGVSARSATSRAHQLRAAERAGKAQRQQRAVSLAGERVRAEAQHGDEQVGGGLGSCLGGSAEVRRMPRSTALTALVGGS
jgi:hypothetical protein